jgi:hypothetical protein
VRIRSGLIGLALRDRVTGQSLLVAEIVPTPGGLIAPNQILFERCFDDLDASLRITVDLSGYHSDVVVHERLDPQWLEANGFSKDTTRIEIWTEIMESPQPAILQRVLDRVTDPSLRRLMAVPEVIEDNLDFGVTKLPLGRAYPESGPRGPGRSVAVPKRWVLTEGRTFLVESMRLAELEPLMAGLPLRDHPSSGNKPLL